MRKCEINLKMNGFENLEIIFITDIFVLTSNRDIQKHHIMSKIIINRISEFSNLLRSIEIYLGETKIGEIRNGESKVFDVNPGKYILKAKIDWCTSNEIHIEVGSDDIFRYNLTGTNPFLGLYYITFGRKNYLKLTPVQ